MNTDVPVLKSLEKAIGLLENLFVLEASRAGIGQSDIRAVLRIDMHRVSRIAKLVKATSRDLQPLTNMESSTGKGKRKRRR